MFKDSVGYRNFVERLGYVLEETNPPCFAWALLTNHDWVIGSCSIYCMLSRDQDEEK